MSQHIFPTLDFHPPTLENLREGLKIITAARSNKHTVYIHCKAGKGRSAVMTTCYLMSVSELGHHNYIHCMHFSLHPTHTASTCLSVVAYLHRDEIVVTT